MYNFVSVYPYTSLFQLIYLTFDFHIVKSIKFEDGTRT